MAVKSNDSQKSFAYLAVPFAESWELVMNCRLNIKEGAQAGAVRFSAQVELDRRDNREFIPAETIG